MPQSQFAEDAASLASYGRRLTVLVEDPSPRALLAMHDALRLYADGCMFVPATASDGVLPLMAGSLQIPVRLAFSEDWTWSVLEELLDYFLHSQTLQTPIEPFYSLASARAGRDEAGTWQIFHEVLGRDYFIDAQRRVSLSARWVQRGEFFGTPGDAPDVFRSSALWTELDGLAERVFTEQAPCAFCPHYPYCAGFWTTTTQPDTSCETWHQAMDCVAAAHEESAARGAKGQRCRTSS